MSENTPETQENGKLSPVQDETVCWSPRFEFDAPRYTNFSSKKFQETRKLLNKLVLNQEEDLEEVEDIATIINDKIIDESEEDFQDLISFTLREDSDSSDIDEWFNRFHPLHEPLRPMTPPGPLISPEKLFIFKPTLQNSLKASPLKLNSPSSTVCELNTPSKGPNTRIGLRSKPARVLKPSQTGSSFNSSPSSLVRSNFSGFPLSSPIKSNGSSPVRTRNFSPIKQSNLMTPTRLSTTSSASSVTLSISSLTKTFYNEPLTNDNVNNNSNDNNIPSSPLKMKTKYSEGISSPLRKAVGVLQLEEEEPPVINAHKKRSIPDLIENTTKKHRPAKVIEEDIKKLLCQHNSRIRPNHANVNNSNKGKQS